MRAFLPAKSGIATLGGLFSLSWCVLAAELEPIDLKPFVGPSQLERLNAAWLFPQGRQVLDGVPFQMDGVIELYGSGPGQTKNPARTNVAGIPVNRICERIHLLAATDDTVAETNVVATIRLRYADESEAKLEIRFGYQVRRWVANMFRAQGALKDPATRIAWTGQHAEAARQSGYARLFHSVFTNPAPDKLVKEISFESAKARAGLWIAAVSVGPADAAPVANSITVSPQLPDLRPHEGAPVSIRGFVRDLKGQPLENFHVRVMGARGLAANEREIRTDDPAVGQEVKTGSDGGFTVPALPDNQLFSLLVFGGDFEPGYYRGAHPGASPIEIRLRTVSEQKLLAHTVRGRVVDPEGQPVPGALVEFNAVSNDGMGTSFSSGSYAGFSDEVSTRANGEFLMTRDKPFVGVQVDISAPKLAAQKVWLSPSNGVQIIEMKTGCMVRGRLLRDGEPVVGMQVGVSGKERESSVFAGHYAVTTGADGRFEFKHLRPATAWWLFGKMSSLQKLGALKPRIVTTLQDGTEVDAGDLELVAGIRLAGKVRTRNGEALPEGLKVTLSLDQVWDSQAVTVDKDGRFAFEGVPPGLVELNLSQNNWRLSSLNRSLDDWNSWQLVGLLEQDKTDLELVIESGKYAFNYRGNLGNGQLPPNDQVRSRPLAGAEESGGPYLTFAGQVLDDDTGKPVTAFSVIPGRQPPVAVRGQTPKPLVQRLTEPFREKTVPWNELIWWDYGREERFTNGNFRMHFQLLTSTPVLRIEASGYDPFVSDAFATPTNGLAFRLTKGVGPSGVVLLPDGKPATGATVIFGAKREQFGLTGVELMTHGGTNWFHRTKADGKFSFPAHQDGELLFAAHTNGWTTLPAKNGKSGLKLRLEPWATVVGVLQQSNGPVMAGVRLHLGGTFDAQRPYVNLGLYCVTDSAGRFFFQNVPGERLNLVRTIPMGTGGGWTHQLQTWVEVEPGVTNDLGTVFYDTPPPPPVLEQLKRKIGL